ncbi:hypothetical protein CC80DRAFT_400484 [Byssothecium circinans]|uniref:ubiquitinyl hydrolase 1 n=1 Tax=Byssothecium circinans TaxID=147558 RepID=A0A6A5UF91_9PLEO|nr:hypothetical protein CC80DRAFT_400484 [Byssothecium circinans]
MASSPEPILQLYQHAALPRFLPGHIDRNLYRIDSALLERFMKTIKTITPFAAPDHQSRLDAIRLALTTSRALNVEGKIDKTTLVKEFGELQGGQALILYATEQNAALLVYRQLMSAGEDDLIFEAFETSAVCEKVLACEGALVWDFPGRAVSVPRGVYTDEGFQQSVAAFLEQSSIESVKQFAAVTHKAAAPLPEIRDTTDPTLITGLFMTILEANGRIHHPVILRKRVRDTVSFKEAHRPWRRSPFYLVLRVAIERHLLQLFGPDGRVFYKIAMCVFLTDLLNDSHGAIPSEDSYFLMQKIGRRLAKLVNEKATASATAKAIHDGLFGSLKTTFEKSLSTIGRYLEQQWSSYRSGTTRTIRPLPWRAYDSELVLKLPLSGQYLNSIAFANHASPYNTSLSPLQLLNHYETIGGKAKPFAAVASRYLALAKFTESTVVPALSNDADCNSSCGQTAHVISSYMNATGNLFDQYSEFKSVYLLGLMELWVQMDRSATAKYPLLKRFHPGFEPEMLNVLELPSLENVQRLQRVQAYLSQRCLDWAGKGTKTIFDSPAEDSFAALYYDRFGDEGGLRELRLLIEREAEDARSEKEKEWRALSKQHEQLMQKVAESTCPYVTTVAPDGKVERVHQRGCPKHRFKWQAKQIKIKIFEHPLPKLEPDIKAVLFELRCPKPFSAYRDATWSLLDVFAYPETKAIDHVQQLRSYVGLRCHSSLSSMTVSLASSTKSHYNCHYAESDFPVALHDVTRTCGLKLDYFDSSSKTWTKRAGKASFSAHFQLQLPKDSPYQSVSLGEWPTSNEVIASQSKCPSDVNVHEFMAWQGLLGGMHRRWLSVLRELGSTNLNFSSESTWAIISKLIGQVGPASSGHILRDVHQVFEDEHFCNKLLEQVSYRLEVIRRNWREPIQMDILISILLKVGSLSPLANVQANALNLLSRVRSITWDWCSKLSSSEATNFAIWASVLCKRTYQQLSPTSSCLESASLETYIGASIILEENLVGKFDYPNSLRIAVLRDLLFTYQIRKLLRKSILLDPDALLSALGKVWPVPEASLRARPIVEMVPESWWVQVTVKGAQATHYVHFNLVHGDLLIDGKQSGTLPSEYRKYAIIQDLFGTHNLRVRPSYQTGMTLFIARPMPNNHWVHLGFRNGDLVLRAVQGSTVLELINATCFRKGSNWDLPSALVSNCYHWLDLGSKVLEVRQDDIWVSKKSNWKLNLYTRRAFRRGSSLVDPMSSVASKVAQNFHCFEYAHNITIFQPSKGPLSVELKRLELSFYVNNAKLLQCRQLRAEIAPSPLQDFGSWYGLRSKIVLRSTQNPDQRIVLIPEGPSKVQKEGIHVKSYIANIGSYLKFEINPVLGRIECPAEPRLLYTKALWHAYTTSFLPDPLTGRTGVEEALQLLQSGLYKPWAPLPQGLHEALDRIAKLSPKRVYYPVSLKCMETVHWQPDLTVTMQDDRYRATIEKISQRSSVLLLFEPRAVGDGPQTIEAGNPHLEARAVARSSARSSPSDLVYPSRDCRALEDKLAPILTLSKVLAEWPADISNTTHIASLLQEFPVLGGYIGPFDRVQVFDKISVDLGENWGSLVQSAIESGPHDRYRLMFLLVPMVLSPKAPMELLLVLLSYAVLPDLKGFAYPKWPSYLQFQSDEIPAAKDLADMMNDAHQPYMPLSLEKATKAGQLALERIKHQEACEHNCLQLAKSIREQWPKVEVDMDKVATVDAKFLNIESALEPVLVEWRRLTQNHDFAKYLEQVQLVLDKHSAVAESRSKDAGIVHDISDGSMDPQVYPTQDRGEEQPSLRELLHKSIGRTRSKLGTAKAAMLPVLQQLPNGITSAPSARVTGQHSRPSKAALQRPEHIEELESITMHLSNSESMVQKDYARELRQSISALVERKAEPSITLPPFNPIQLSHDIQQAQANCDSMLCDIYEALEAGDERAKWLKIARLWPKRSRLELIAELRSTSGITFGEGTKEALVEFGLELTALQRLLRIRDASLKGRYQQLIDERTNAGHCNWLPLENADWLLLEIDSDMMLRPEQIEVAHATIFPPSGQNSVVQLLMGKGKTSCILPMVAAVLADKKNLLRVIVPRALLLQSAQVMQVKLGGLLDRDVMHIPFSRKTPTHRNLMQSYSQLHLNLRKDSGVMIALPEHILSFKLSGLQRLCDGHLEEARPMIKIQEWLERNARDVLDECDVSLAIKTQLIYPSGSQTVVDGHPSRWLTIQMVIGLMRAYLPHLAHKYPQSIEVVEREVGFGDFPLVYFLRPDVEQYFLTLIVDDVCKGQLATLPCAEIPANCQEDIKIFISKEVVPNDVDQRVTSMFKDKQHTMKVLYHLRGLFVHRIFMSTLKKRWNVQYGLHASRDPIAVPYHAKGVPSPTSEWGHPDVAIVLTCLSFYYEGLNELQFKQAFEQLLKADEPSIEYDKWATPDLPAGLRDYTSVNVEDSSQLRELHRHVRFNVYLLNFYMNSFVFPRHAKQFDMKLQASGWDLVLYDPEKPKARTTGFSGTNDSRHQLPMTIKQNDLPKLAYTNAEVLSYLLLPRNRRYIRMVNQHGRFSEVDLVNKLFNPYDKFVRDDYTGEFNPDPKERIRVLIDAGAQILEHDNISLVKAWLKVDRMAAAAVFFDSDHRPWVLYRKGTRIPLVASPFAESLDECVVYLDESHCRGTDLKLPPNARAALTLGPHVTKDALVQAAMRLRLLGQSQAVTFFSPQEVHQSILDLSMPSSIDGSRDRLSGVSSPHQVSSSDVIYWLLNRSCETIEQLEPLYFAQGNTYTQQIQAKNDFPDFFERPFQRERLLASLRSKELFSLKQLYEPTRRPTNALRANFMPSLKPFVKELIKRKNAFQDRGHAVHGSTFQEVEQEREVELEIESVRESQKPIHFNALKIPRIHKDMEAFAKLGEIKPGSDAYQSMLSALQQTASGLKHGAFTILSRPRLFVSTQFTRTVKVVEPNDNFLRSCQWVLWNTHTQLALVISPEEADALIPLLRRYRNPKSTGGSTHLIVYSAPVTRRMLDFNNLDYYALPSLPSGYKMPSWLKIELGIFAGRLYFAWDEYEELAAYLGVQTRNDGENHGFDRPEAFVKKPLTFLHNWLAVLRKGADFEQTPMGFVTTGKPLSANHPFFLASAGNEPTVEPKLKKVFFGAPEAEQDEVPSDSEDEQDDEDYEFHGVDEDLVDGRDGSLDGEDSDFFDAEEYVEGGKSDEENENEAETEK